MTVRWERWVMGSGAVALLVFILSTILTPPATSYEASLYAAYHPITWLAFAIAVVVSLAVLTLSPRYRGRAVVGIAALYAVFLTLPAQRGYVLFAAPSSDILYHLGIVRDFTSTSTPHLPLYPMLHMLLTAIAAVTDLSLNQLQPIGSLVATTLLIAGTVVAGRQLVDDRVEVYILVAALPLVFTIHHIGLQPWFFAITLIPVTLAATVASTRDSDWQMKALALILAAVLVLYHPLTAIFGLFAIAIVMINSTDISDRVHLITRATFVLAPVTLFIYWILHFRRSQITIMRFLVDDARSGTFSYASQSTSMDVPLWRLMWEYLILQWGTVLIYGGFAGLATIYLLWRLVKGRSTSGTTTIAVLYLAGVAFGVVFAMADLFSKNPRRIGQFGLVIAPLCIGYVLWITLDQRSGTPTLTDSHRSVDRNLGAILLVGVICTALLAGGTLYSDHRHLSESTIEGTAWHLDHHDRELSTHSHRMAINLELYYHGFVGGIARERVFSRYNSELQLPHRLGYDDHATVAEWTSGYLITKTEDVVQAREVSSDDRSDTTFYTQEDQKRLERDKNANAVYDNGEFWVWQTA